MPGYRIAAVATVTTPASGPLQIAMNGNFDRANRSGTMIAAETVAGHRFKFTEVFSGLTFFMHATGLPQLPRLTGGRRWLKFDMSRMLGAMGIGSLPTGTDPSEFVDFLRAVSASSKTVGTATVRGVATTDYSATIDLDRYSKPVPRRSDRGEPRRRHARGRRWAPTSCRWTRGSTAATWSGASASRSTSAWPADVQFGMKMDIFDYGPQSQPSLPRPASSTTSRRCSPTLSRIKFGCATG